MVITMSGVAQRRSVSSLSLFDKAQDHRDTKSHEDTGVFHLNLLGKNFRTAEISGHLNVVSLPHFYHHT